jgi:hypothetical protein
MTIVLMTSTPTRRVSRIRLGVIKKAAVEIGKRFVKYLLELSESVTGRINRGIEVLRRAAFQGLSDKYQKVGYSCNMWEPVCPKSSTEGRDFVIFPLGNT